MSESDPRVVEKLEAMTPQQVQELIVRLTDFADWSIRTRARWMKRPFLPKGYDAGSLASEAITRALDPDGRRWNPENDPDLLMYLKSVVRSILWDLQKAAEKEALDDVDDDELERMKAKGSSADEELEAAELQEELLEYLKTDEERLVLLTILEGKNKAADIAASLGLDVEKVYKLKWQIKQHLRRRLDRSVSS